MKKSSNRKHRKKQFRLNWHLLLFALILIIAATAIIKLVIWNAGTKSDFDPAHIAEGGDVEPLDTIIPLSDSKLEGHEDDGVMTVLCLGNNPLTDETGERGFVSLLSSKTNATVYNGGFPDSTIGTKYSVYNEGYPRDNFNLPHEIGRAHV